MSRVWHGDGRTIPHDAQRSEAKDRVGLLLGEVIGLASAPSSGKCSGLLLPGGGTSCRTLPLKRIAGVLEAGVYFMALSVCSRPGRAANHPPLL